MSYYKKELAAQTAGGGDIVTVLGSVETTDDTEQIVAAIKLIPPAGFSTVTGVATNNATFTFRQVRAGTVIATLGTFTTGVGNNLAAETVQTATLTNPQTAALAADDVIDVLQHQNGTGQAIGVGIAVEVEIA